MAATTPESASSASRLGTAIRPLKKSAMAHTRSTFSVEPTKMNTTGNDGIRLDRSRFCRQHSEALQHLVLIVCNYLALANDILPLFILYGNDHLRDFFTFLLRRFLIEYHIGI